MSKKSEFDFGRYYVFIFFLRKDQFVILYFVDDFESFGDSLVFRVIFYF